MHGIPVLIIDYRGFGESGGDPSSILISQQVDDLVAAVSYLRRRPDIETGRIGVFGSGGTGGGNAILLAAQDKLVKCTVAQVPIADGEDWLRRMRTEQEWATFRERVNADRRSRANGGRGERIDPRNQITIPTSERKKTTVKSDVDARIPTLVSLRLAEDLFDYRPIDVVSEVSHLMIVAVERDNVTPTEHAAALFVKATTPKHMVMQRGTAHYSAYQQYGSEVIPRIVGWFKAHLDPSSDNQNHASWNVEIIGAGSEGDAIEI